MAQPVVHHAQLQCARAAGAHGTATQADPTTTRAPDFSRTRPHAPTRPLNAALQAQSTMAAEVQHEAANAELQARRRDHAQHPHPLMTAHSAGQALLIVLASCAVAFVARPDWAVRRRAFSVDACVARQLDER